MGAFAPVLVLLWYFLEPMVTAARLEWILRQLWAGRKVCICMNTYPDKAIMKVRLLCEYGSHAQNGFAISWIAAISDGLQTAIAVDHGHANSKGESIINMTLSPAASAAPVPAHDMVDGMSPEQ